MSDHEARALAVATEESKTWDWTTEEINSLTDAIAAYGRAVEQEVYENVSAYLEGDLIVSTNGGEVLSMIARWCRQREA